MRCFVVHDLADALKALHSLKDRLEPVMLRSPPFGAQSLGPSFFSALIESARKNCPDLTILGEIDCGDDPGLALASLRAGIDAVRIDAAAPVLEKLADIANVLGNRLISTQSGNSLP